jgi:hypothetical protein
MACLESTIIRSRICSLIILLLQDEMSIIVAISSGEYKVSVNNLKPMSQVEELSLNMKPGILRKLIKLIST